MSDRYSYSGRLTEEDPDEYCYDSTPYKSSRFKNVDEIDLDNISSREFMKNEGPRRYKSNIVKQQQQQQHIQEALKGMVYPKTTITTSSSESGTTMNTQKDYINSEANYSTTQEGKSTFIKHYEVLRWHFKGYPTKEEGCMLYLNVDEILKQYGQDRCMIRAITPVTGCNTMVGFTAHIDCLSYKHLNNRPSTSNLSLKRCKHFVSISPGGVIERYEGGKKTDILEIGKLQAIDRLKEYVDDNERHPFQELMEQYNQYFTKHKAEVKKHYKTYPTNGEEYLQELIDYSKKVPLKDITKMEEKKWIENSFVNPLNDKTKTYYTLYNPEKSQYAQFTSRCPFHEGQDELRYFNKPYGKHAKISLPRHLEVLKVLRILKTTQGAIKGAPFLLTAEGKCSKTYNKHTPGCVTLKVCVKLNMK